MRKDPYKYFRVEAQELSDQLSEGVVALERGFDEALVARLLRLAHTLKGAARVVKQPEIAKRAHDLEGVLAPTRSEQRGLRADEVRAALALIERIATAARALGASPEPIAVPARAIEHIAPETVRIDIHEMDELLRRIREVSVSLAAIRRSVGALSTIARSSDPIAVARALLQLEAAAISEIEHAERDVASARSAAEQLRLVPARVIVPALALAVRDAAQTLGKSAMLETSGGDIRLDTHVLAELGQALPHMVRNAVAHGIEAPDDRRARGKPATGVVHLSFERARGVVIVRCRDDGRGVDLDAVRRVAITRGLSADASREALLGWLASGGITTASTLTEIAGRGIGLDVARETASRLKGTFTIESETGRGATMTLRVPTTLSSVEVILLETARATYALPLEVVRSTSRVEAGEIAQTGSAESVLLGGEVVPFASLDRGLGERSPAPSIWSAARIEVDGKQAVIGANRLVDTETVIMHGVPPELEASAIVAGIALDADGNARLVLDAASLIDAASKPAELDAAARATRLPILVIDDSLTTRMLEQSILESAGYEVDLATSAEDGIAKAHKRAYGLFLVDVEMPGMDGFGFVAHTRADERTRDTPAILVTSRNAPEDLARGIAVGAKAYIVKSEFDQRKLLDIIAKLVV